MPPRISLFDRPGMVSLRRELRLDPNAVRQLRNDLLKHFGSDEDALLRFPAADRVAIHSLELFHRSDSTVDGATKLLLKTAGGMLIESVILRVASGRTALCVSSQVGCAAACDFCATGKMGIARNLTPDEILDQLLIAGQLLAAEKRTVRNIVFMGMGEPFHNYDEVLAFCKLANDADGYGLGARSIAISTAGWIPGIDRLAKEPIQVKLAVSLHAPNDEIRGRLMPVNRRYPVAEVMEACQRYRDETRRRIFIEYLLLEGVNDSIELARELAELLRAGGPGAFHVNLIAYNPTDSPYVGSSDAVVSTFRRQLEKAAIGTSYRRSRGQGIEAACGQLAMQGMPARKRAAG